MKAGGLSPVALEEEMARKLEKYFVEPLVSVYVKEYRSAKIGVMGAVKQPQVFAVTGQKNLLEMLSMAGGLAPDASSLCYVMRTDRGGDGSSNKETIVIDLDALLEQGNTALNMSLHGGDMIHVPKGGVVYVDGAVEKPGVFSLTPKTTLMRALAMAGGIKFEADKSDIKVIRETGKGAREVLTFDYDSVKDGGREDILVKEGDIIVVSRSGFKTFLTTIMRGAFSFGGGSVGLGGLR